MNDLMISDYYNRLSAIAKDWCEEHRGWNSYHMQEKHVPHYGDQAVLGNLQQDGQYLYYACPVIRSAVEKFISYVVFSGHTYDVLEYETKPSTAASVTKQQLKEMKWIIEWTQENCFPGGWQAMQEETVRRWLVVGEAFREHTYSNESLVVRFPEPYQVRQKPGIEVPGKMGIVFDEDDAASVRGYWVNRRPAGGSRAEDFDYVPSSKMQHIKYGVDANDLRGVGPFPMLKCHSVRIRNTDVAMVELALTQSQYAVVRQHDNIMTVDKIRKIAEGFKDAQKDDSGVRTFGKEVDAKGFKFEFPSMGVNPMNFVEIIAQEVRFIAGVLDMPEFILLTSAGEGSRAGIVSAEGPFARRIGREQVRFSYYDIQLLWESIRRYYGWTYAQMREMKKAVKIVPNFPLPYTRDILKDTQAVVEQVKIGLSSKRQGRERLGNDNEQVVQDLRVEKEVEADLVPDIQPESDQTDSASGPSPRPASARG